MDETRDWRHLRPISILPALIQILEKLTFSILKSEQKGVLTICQYAGFEGSDCNLAKVSLFYQLQQMGQKRCLLIDIKKAYDSVRQVDNASGRTFETRSVDHKEHDTAMMRFTSK